MQTWMELVGMMLVCRGTWTILLSRGVVVFLGYCHVEAALYPTTMGCWVFANQPICREWWVGL